MARHGIDKPRDLTDYEKFQMKQLSNLLFGKDKFKTFPKEVENSPQMKMYENFVAIRQRYLQHKEMEKEMNENLFLN